MATVSSAAIATVAEVSNREVRHGSLVRVPGCLSNDYGTFLELQDGADQLYVRLHNVKHATGAYALKQMLYIIGTVVFEAATVILDAQLVLPAGPVKLRSLHKALHERRAYLRSLR